MSSPLNLFPARIAIGKWRDPDSGKDVPVLMSTEFERALSALLQRVGGPMGTDTADLEVIASQAFPAPVESPAARDALRAQSAESFAATAQQMRAVADLQAAQLSESRALLAEANKAIEGLLRVLGQSNADVAELRKQIDGVSLVAGYRDPFRVDWEHPGAIGSKTASSGAFTTLSASAAVTLSPANANVVISPTGTGLMTISPAAVGSMDNVTIGATTPRALNGTTGVFTQTIDVRGIFGIFGTNVAAAGQGGNCRFRNDAGTLNWVAGMPGTAAATSFHIFDVIAGVARLTINAAGQVTLGIGMTVPGGAQFLTTNTVLTNGAAAAAGTLTNAPTAGNPTKWIGINDNGTVRYIPAW